MRFASSSFPSLRFRLFSHVSIRWVFYFSPDTKLQGGNKHRLEPYKPPATRPNAKVDVVTWNPIERYSNSTTRNFRHFWLFTRDEDAVTTKVRQSLRQIPFCADSHAKIKLKICRAVPEDLERQKGVVLVKLCIRFCLVKNHSSKLCFPISLFSESSQLSCITRFLPAESQKCPCAACITIFLSAEISGI